MKGKILEKMKLIDSVKETKERMLAAMDWTDEQYNNFIGCLRSELSRLHYGDDEPRKRVV